VREVDRYKAAKLAEGTLAPNTVNKTLTRLSQILSLAAEYGLIPANPAAGKRRRVKGTKPRRPWAEPEQLLALLEAATSLLGGAAVRSWRCSPGQDFGSTRRSLSSART
jgi:hypothetical protein